MIKEAERTGSVEETYQKIGDNPKFVAFVKKRNGFALVLAAIVLVVYYTFVLFASLMPTVFGTPVAEGSSLATGLLVGWGIQAFAFLMTGVYVLRANSEFDATNRAIIEEASE